VTGLEVVHLDALPELTRRFSARRCVVVRDGVMEEISERVAMRLQRGEDYIAQCLTVMRVVREMLDAGLLHVWPRPLANVPVPTPGMARRAMDLILPDDRCLVLVVWESTALWTAVVLRRRGGSVDFVAG